MAGDVAANICRRDSGLAAECGNQNFVQIIPSDNCQAKQKKKIDRLARLPVWQLHPIRPHLLPRRNHLADDWIDRLGKCCACFVDGNIEHANRTAG